MLWRKLSPSLGYFSFTAALSSPSRWYSSRLDVTEEELRHLEQELPPRELLQEMRTSDARPNEEEDTDISIPGDSFGIMRNRVAFYRPIPRKPFEGNLGELMPTGTHPHLCANEVTVKSLCGRYGVTPIDAVMALQMAEGNVNEATFLLQQKYKIEPKFGDYGVVCLEAYAPETFCLVSYNLPSYEAIFDDNILDAIHELTLSAAELPLDTPRKELKEKFISDWTIEDDSVLCGDFMKEHDITVKEILLLPYGDYSVQGFYIEDPVKEDVPNIGTAAAACCMDLRTGIHNRFRFHVERICDSVSEHVAKELIHYGQRVHMLRQPYWFRPEYSVEEFIRFKESLLQPSASIFEMRYAVLLAPGYNVEGFRNIVELEKLKIAQHKHEKHYEDFTAPGKMITSDNAQLQTVAAAGGGSNVPGGIMHSGTNEEHSRNSAMETKTGPLRRSLGESMQKHGDRVFERFYRNNYH